MKNYYEILGVSENASDEEISKAYRDLAKKHHPDRGGDSDKFKAAAEAFEVLSDSKKKQDYDLRRSGNYQEAPNFSGFDFSDLFSSVFNRRQKQKIDDYVVLDLSFEEAVLGCKKSIEYKAYEKNKCQKCNGTGQQTIKQGTWHMSTGCQECMAQGFKFDKTKLKQTINLNVEIPAGVDTGNNILVSTEVGEILIKVKVNSLHENVHREGNDIYIIFPICYSELLLNKEFKITFLKEEIKFKVPDGFRLGKKIRIREKGIKVVNSSEVGDMYIVPQLIIPDKIDEGLIKKLSIKEKANMDNSSKNFRQTFNIF